MAFASTPTRGEIIDDHYTARREHQPRVREEEIDIYVVERTCCRNQVERAGREGQPLGLADQKQRIWGDNGAVRKHRLHRLKADHSLRQRARNPDYGLRKAARIASIRFRLTPRSE